MKLNRRALTLSAVLCCAGCLGLAAVVWQVERTLHQSKIEQGRSADLGVEVKTLDRQANPGFEALGAPAVFKSAAIYEGNLYLSGPQGLSVYTLNGELEKVYHVGMEIPTAALGKMVVGMVAGARRPELLIATAGAGVLAFDGAGFRQIVPKTEEGRTVTALLPLSSGRLLLGTAKLGVLIFDGKSLKHFHPTLDNYYITALAGSESSLGVGTLNDGLFVWRGGETTHLSEEQGLPDRRVEAIAMQGERIFAGTPMGVAEVRQGKVERVLANGSFAHALLLDGDQLLVGEMASQIAHLRLSGNTAGIAARRQIQALTSEKGDGNEGKKTPEGKNPLVRQSAPQLTAGNDSGALAVEEFLVSGESRYALTGNGLPRWNGASYSSGHYFSRFRRSA